MRTSRFVCISIAVAMTWIGPLAAIASAQPCFNPAQNYAAGSSPLSVIAAYLNGDGYLDLAVVNYNAHRVTVLMNHGDGTYPDTHFYAVGSSPKSVVAADLDGDGDQDLAVANYSTHDISVLSNTGVGRFVLVATLVIGTWPNAIVAADLDGDGKQDLAVANGGTNPSMIGTVTVLKNKGDWLFDQLPSFDAGWDPWSIIAADMDGVAGLDLVVVNRRASYAPPSHVSVLRNNGDGTDFTRYEYNTGFLSSSAIAADLDGDGKLDLAVTNSGSDLPPYTGSSVWVLKNNGDGTFPLMGNYAAGIFPYAVFAADLDGVAGMDLAVANKLSNNVSVLKNNGTWSFDPAVNYATGGYSMSVLAADLDGDGDQDLAVANSNGNNVSVLINGIPNAVAGPDQVLTCTVSQVNLSGSSSTPGATFSWVASGGGHIVSDATTATPLVDAAGTYTMTVTAPTGCVSTDVALVTQNVTPPNADAGPDKALGCTVTQINLSGFSSTPGATFNWVASSGGNIVSGATTATPLINAVGTYTLTVIDPAGCTANDVALVATNCSVVVESKEVVSGATGVDIHVFITNDVAWSAVVVPLVIRSLTPGAFITSLQLSYADRLVVPGVMEEFPRTDQFASVENGNCRSGYPGGFGTKLFDDDAPHPVTASPVGLVFGRIRFSDSPLSPGADVTGSMIMRVNVTSTSGIFEIDTTCTTPTSHLAAVGSPYAPTIVPRFTKGIITIGGSVSFSGYSPVSLVVVDPTGDSIGPDVNTIGSAVYESAIDYNGDADPDDRVTIFGALPGTYHVRVKLKDGADPNATYTLGVLERGNPETFPVQNAPVPPPGQTAQVDVGYCDCPHQGDINGDGVIDVFDVIGVIGIAFSGDTDPQDTGCPDTRGDVDNNGGADVFDVIYLIATAFSGGPNPVDPCGP